MFGAIVNWFAKSKQDDEKDFVHPHAVSDKDSLDFLPAALEILERPPSPAGRILGYSLIALTVIAVLWAFIGKVDVVATAEGKIIPSGRVKLIQPLQMGVVKSIFVKEGQLVEKGQALIELDQTLTGADKDRLLSDIGYLSQNLERQHVLRKLFELERKRAGLNEKASSKSQAKTIEISIQEIREQLAELSASLDPNIHHASSGIGANNALSTLQKENQAALSYQLWLEYQNAIQITRSRIHSKHSELNVAKANIQRFESTIPLITKRVNALNDLYKKSMGSEMELLESQEQQITQQQSLIAEQARRERIQSEITELQQTLNAQQNIARLENLQQIDALGQQLASAAQELNKADELFNKQILTSPVKGRVKQLTVNTVGGIVEEAKVLMQIVPGDGYLEVEAVLQNKDIGFVYKGQKAEVKIHTFPFTKYGVIDAEVLDITADAIESEQQGLVYSVHLKMQQNKLWVDKGWIELIPGMAVTAEVKTNKRRLIEFFMSPLLRYRDESVRER